MHKTIKIFLISVMGLAMACTSKTVTLTPTGDRKVITETDSSKYSDAQAAAWTAYYSAAANPPVIAKITQPDGTVIDIHSQVHPPTPDIKQHRNQIIEPVERMISMGVKVIGGGLVLREIVDAMQGVTISNSGAGNITYDRSDTVAVDTTTVDGSTIKENSDNPSTVTEDNHVEHADPIVVTNTEKTTTTTTATETITIDESATE